MSNNTENETLSIMVENYFCVLSNLFCLIPAYLHIKNSGYYDSIFIFVTGITSIFYHLNNNKYPIINFFNSYAIKYADIVLSDLLIIQTATYLAFYKNYNIRASILFLILPFQIYVCIIDNIYRTIFTFTNLALYLPFVFYKFYKYSLFRKFPFFLFFIGTLINSIELICYEYLQKNINYNIFHGFHHFCAFISISIYYYVPIEIKIYKEPKIQNNRNDTDNNIQETVLDTIKYNNEIVANYYVTSRLSNYENDNTSDINSSRDNLLN